MKAKIKCNGREIDVYFDDNKSFECKSPIWQALIDREIIYFHERELEFIEDEKHIDWEQRRYEIAKELLAAHIISGAPIPDYVESSVEFANDLIEALKKQNA